MKFLRNTKITVSIGIVVAVSLLIGFSLNFIIMDGQMDADACMAMRVWVAAESSVVRGWSAGRVLLKRLL